MKKMLTFTAFMITTILAASAFPATENGKVDKQSQNEVSVNLVTEHVTAAAVDAEKDKKYTMQPHVSVSVGGTIGVSVPGEDDTKTARPLFPLPPVPPTKNPNVFSRFIDDVFQIPITVLQSVSKLLTNPFTQRNKEKEPASA